MPKQVNPENDPFEGVGPSGAPEQSESTVPTSKSTGKRKAGEPTQRELARMKKKQAVLAKIQEDEQTRASCLDDTVESSNETERELKRARDGTAES